MKAIPTIKKIITTDMIALMSAVFSALLIPIFIAIPLYDSFKKGYVLSKNNDILITMSVVGLFLVLLSLSLLLYRLNYIKSIFKNGIECKGEIINTSFFKDRAYIKYEYEIKGQKYQRTKFLHQTFEVKQLKRGLVAVITYNPLTPERSEIKNIYFDEE